MFWLNNFLYLFIRLIYLFLYQPILISTRYCDCFRSMPLENAIVTTTYLGYHKFVMSLPQVLWCDGRSIATMQTKTFILFKGNEVQLPSLTRAKPYGRSSSSFNPNLTGGGGNIAHRALFWILLEILWLNTTRMCLTFNFMRFKGFLNKKSFWENDSLCVRGGPKSSPTSKFWNFEKSKKSKINIFQKTFYIS